jgi:hypothetical protein
VVEGVLPVVEGVLPVVELVETTRFSDLDGARSPDKRGSAGGGSGMQ